MVGFTGAGIAVDEVEGGEVGEAECAGEEESAAPSEAENDDADEGYADGGGELGGGVKEAGGEAAAVRREPASDGLGVGGEEWGFADAEEQARGVEDGDGGGGRGCEGREAPEKGADAADGLDAEAVEERAHGDLADGVGDVVRAEEVSVDDVVDAEGVLEAGVCDGKVDAIKVVDEYADAEEDGDVPAHAMAGIGWVEDLGLGFGGVHGRR